MTFLCGCTRSFCQLENNYHAGCMRVVQLFSILHHTSPSLHPLNSALPVLSLKVIYIVLDRKNCDRSFGFRENTLPKRCLRSSPIQIKLELRHCPRKSEHATCNNQLSMPIARPWPTTLIPQSKLLVINACGALCGYAFTPTPTLTPPCTLRVQWARVSRDPLVRC